MRIRMIIFLQVFYLLSCQEKEPSKEIKITNFKGITSTDNLGNYTGELDSTDWTYEMEEWTQEEVDLFGSICPCFACLTTNQGTLKAYPNATNDYIYLNINNQGSGIRFSYRLVDRYFNILMAGDSLNPPNNSTLILSLNNITHTTDTLRLYYSFFDITGLHCTMSYHGDIVKQQ